ncbi:MAG: TlpA family protein disulfide reductase [Candidatus Cryptobacteroides sp.]
MRALARIAFPAALLLLCACSASRHRAPASAAAAASADTLAQAPAVADSAQLAKLEELLQGFYYALLPESVEVKVQECESLMMASSDSLLRNWIGQRIMEHYMEPPLMGEEEVAVVLYEKWYKSGRLAFSDEMQAFGAALFYEYNRQSLLGMQAPQLLLCDLSGRKAVYPREGHYSIFFFYDAACAKCKALSAALPDVLKDLPCEMDFYAVYCGSDRQAWEEFASRFLVSGPKVKLFHLSDFEMESGYPLKYAVSATPRLFFIGNDGSILGRRLDSESLKQIIDIIRLYYGQVEEQKG